MLRERTVRLAILASTLVGCGEPPPMMMPPRMDAGRDAGEILAFPDAVSFDSPTFDTPLPDAPFDDTPSFDAPIPDAFVAPDAWVMPPPDAFVPPPDAWRPDAFSECMEGTRVPCMTSCGSTGSAPCTGGRIGTCAPPAEVCNGTDDDCVGGPDDSFACVRGRTESCTTSCASVGARACGASCGWGACIAPSEACNMRDDDCDGTVDEGLYTSVVTTTYDELAMRHSGCDGLSERIGLNCNTAIVRLCDNGCTTSGFGPVESAGAAATVACVLGEVRTVGYDELSTYQPVCNPIGERIGPSCNAAIHRYCAASGFVSGFGPTSMGAASATITCVASAEVRTTTYAVLAVFQDNCTGTGERVGPNCNTAVHRYCIGQGFPSGFGPVENDGVNATVTCVRP